MKARAMPKASIIVPAYNAAATLLQTLDSLLNQTFRDMEIIVVDDGSTDATRRIAEAYCADPRMRVVRQPNRGPAAARNSGIAVARGRYVGFCDADDTWHPQKLAIHVEHLDADPEVGLSYSAATQVDEDDRPLGQFNTPKLRNISAEHLFKRNPVGTVSTVVARREALEDLSYRPYCESDRDWVFDEHLRGYEDFECWLRMTLMTGWKIEGVRGLLTRQRVNLAAFRDGVDRQVAAWDQMITALRPADPAFFSRHEPAARAHQLHFLSRSRAADPQAARAEALMRDALTDRVRDRAPTTRSTPSGFAAMIREALNPGLFRDPAGPVPTRDVPGTTPPRQVERTAPASWV